MHLILWVISLLLIAVSIYFIFMNGMVFFNNYILKKKWVSAIPFIGGISGAIGLSLLPIYNVWRYAWIPAVIDWGFIPLLLVSLVSRCFGRSVEKEK